MGRLTYAAVTPARNEAENLERLADSMRRQTLQPLSWTIVENGSTDDTRRLAEGLAAADATVHVKIDPGGGAASRGAPIVRALERAVEELPETPDIVVNVDADISFESDFFEALVGRFEADPELGIASGSCFELEKGSWKQRHVTGNTVWGATRAYRTACFEAVRPLEGRLGWDGIDELKAQARGWRTETIRDLPFRHHRRVGQRDGRIHARRQQGRTAHFMGYRAWYLALRSLRNTLEDPLALAMVAGYVEAGLRREPRMADAEAVAYLRRQQRLSALPARAREAFGLHGD